MTEKEKMVELAGLAFDIEANFYDQLGLITGTNTSIYIDVYDGDYVINGRISTSKEGSKTGTLYKGKDRKKALWFANEVINSMKKNVRMLEKEKEETFRYE